jgi:uncharacterized protein (TIGR03086 family)
MSTIYRLVLSDDRPNLLASAQGLFARWLASKGVDIEVPRSGRAEVDGTSVEVICVADLDVEAVRLRPGRGGLVPALVDILTAMATEGEGWVWIDLELHGRCGRRFAALVTGMSPEQWHDNTPCSEWDVRALVHHLLYEQRWVPVLFEGLTIDQVGDRFEGDLMGDDTSTWPSLLASSIEEAHTVVAKPEALERTVHHSFGDAPAPEYVMQLTADLAIHSWDLARGHRAGRHPRTRRRRRAAPLDGSERRPAGRVGHLRPPIDTGREAPDDVRLLGLLGRPA